MSTPGEASEPPETQRVLSTNQGEIQHERSQSSQKMQTFYQENLILIYRYMYREEAEDLTSQTFVKAMHGVDYQRGPQSMQKWLFQVARTTIADYWRGYYRASISSLEELLDAGWEGPTEEEPVPVNTTPAQKVASILQVLPERYREVLKCRFLLNLSIKETALRMKLSEANVKVLQFRALRCAADIEEVITP